MSDSCLIAGTYQGLVMVGDFSPPRRLPDTGDRGPGDVRLRPWTVED